MTSKPLPLDEDAQWAGLWWLPDVPDEKVPGILRFDAGDGDITLTLIGAFENRVISEPSPGVTRVHEGSRTWDVIHGVAEHREITLLGCVPTRTDRTLGARVRSPDKQTIKATAAIVGAHVDDEQDAAFAAVEMSVEDLGTWAATSAFEVLLGASETTFDGAGQISVRAVPAQSVVVAGTEYRLAHIHALPGFDIRRGDTTASTRHTACIRATPQEPFGLSAAIEAASVVQDLIALAVHRAAGALWLRLEVARTEAAPNNGQPTPRRRAEVLYSPATVGRQNAKAVDDSHVLFTCASLPFEQVVPRWCETRDRLHAAINMILGLRYAPARFIENNLLTAVGAAEVLHRNLRMDVKPFPATTFAQMRDAMLEQVPEEHRSRFRGAIRNDPTLRDRLIALAGRPDHEAVSMLMPDVAHWAQRATRARNDLAHEGRTPNHSFDELIAVVEVTTTVVLLNVLQEVGVPPERQRDIMQQHPQLRSTARLAHDRLHPTQNP